MNFIKDCKADWLGAHLEIRGFEMMRGVRNVHGMSPDVFKKFDRNHRTIQRRINALKDEGLLVPIIKRNTITLYQIFNTEE